MVKKRKSDCFASPTRNSQNLQTSRSPLERKQSLRAVLNRTKTIHNIDESTVENLEHIVREADNISLEATIEEKVVGHDEVLMDSEVMAVSSRALRSGAYKLTKTISPYCTKNYAENLLKYVYSMPDETTETHNWSMLEIEVSKIFKKTPNYTALCGCLEPLEPKVVVKRQTVKRDALAPIKRPEAIVEVGKDDDSVEETVSRVKKLVTHYHRDKGEPLEFFRLVIHPDDFGKTIENILHVAFLVRDGVVQMKTDENGNPVVLPSSKEMKARAKKSGKNGNSQNVFALSVQQWQVLVKELKIKKPMINFH